MSFQQSLGVGQIGEMLFYQAHEGKLEKLDGFKSDFKLLETGQGLELKTDSYFLANSPNFFMEYYSNLEKKSPGGPRQALEHGSDIFVYFYIKDLTFYKFETKKLVEALEQLAQTTRPTDVRNKTYVTRGYLVPRVLLKDLYTEHKLEVRVKE